MSALSKLRDIQKNTPNHGLTELTKVESLQYATSNAPNQGGQVISSVLSVTPQACFFGNEGEPTAKRWRVTQADGRVFEVDTWPFFAMDEIQAGNPGSVCEPIPGPTPGALAPADEALILRVLQAWKATDDEIHDAIAESSANPALLDGWRREAEKLADDELTKLTEVVSSVLSVIPQACFSEIPVQDDRILCEECRRLKPGNLCGSPVWAPRYHPPHLPHRCVEFQPKAVMADQRTGRERWPQLVEVKP